MRIGDILNLYRLSTGSILFCLNETEKLMAGMNNPTLAQRVAEARTACEAARELDLNWRMGKRDMPMVRKGAADIDQKIDRTLSGLMSLAQLNADLVDDSPMRQQARELRDALFAEGVFPITSLKYEDQHAAVDEILSRLRGQYTAHVATLNMGHLVTQLEQLNRQFGDKLSVLNQTGVSFDQVDAARVDAESAFHRVVLQILADYMDDDQTRAQLLRPLADQNERARTFHKRRGRTPQVDPDTGVVIDDIEEPIVDGGSGLVVDQPVADA